MGDGGHDGRSAHRASQRTQVSRAQADMPFQVLRVVGRVEADITGTPADLS